MARHRRPAGTLSPTSRERVATARATAAGGYAPARLERRPLRRRRLWAGLFVALVLIAVGFITHTFTDVPLPDRLQDGFTLAVSVLIESLPFVMLGVLLAVVIEVWVPPGAIERWLPRAAWARRAVLSLLGMLVPVCECGNVPFARGMLMRGFSVPETLTFLMAAPIVNPIVIITTHQAFGFSDGILVARLLGGYAIANLIGWLYSRHPSPASLLTPRFALTCAAPAPQDEIGRGRRSATQLLAELRAVMPALVLGSALAGAIQVLVPRDVLIAIGSDPVLSLLAMAVLAVVVAICSNVDAFFALSFASTFTPGSIVAFLLIGPLVDVKMLALLRTTFTARLLVGLVAIVVVSAFFIGGMVNLVG